MKNTNEVMDMGMRCLVEGLGIIEAEHFISVIIKEKFDYTKWQRDFFDGISPDALHDAAVRYAKEHPYKGRATTIITNG